MRKKLGCFEFLFCYRAMGEGEVFFLFYENEKIMTQPLFPYCGNKRGKFPLFESCFAFKDANIRHYVTYNKL